MCTSYEWAELVYVSNGDHHQSLKVALELYIKDCLDIQRYDRWNWMLVNNSDQCQGNGEQCRELSIIFKNNHINIGEFAKAVHDVLNCVDEKKNCLRLIGCSNSCKTLIASCIAAPFITSYVNNHNSENEFYLSAFLNKTLALCEELFVTTATAEDFKSILGGAPLNISKKYNEKQILTRTPVIVTSNHEKFGRGHIPLVDEAALANRCFTFRFSVPYKPKCHIEPASLAHYLNKWF